MNTEESKLKSLVAQECALADQVWAAAREKKDAIDRMRREGCDYSIQDQSTCKFLAHLVSGELSSREYYADIAADHETINPLLAGGQGRPTQNVRDSSLAILMCLCGAAGAILGGIIGYLLR